MIRKRFAAITLTCALGASALFAPLPAWAANSEELQAQLDDANAKLEELFFQAEAANQEVLKTQGDLDTITAEVESAQAQLTESQDALANRVASDYKTGGVSFFDILFSSTSIEDFLSRTTYAARVAASDAATIQEVKDIKAELETKQAEQEELLAEKTAKQEEFESSATAYESYVDSLSDELQQAIAEEQEAARKAAEEAAAKAAAEEAARKAEEEAAIKAAEEAAAAANAKSSGISTDATTSDSASGGLTQEQRNQIVAAAWAKVGLPYLWGGTGPDAYDCSGFVQYCYAQAGISLPRIAADQGAVGSSTTNPQAGDMVCWGHHIGIYIGDGMMIDAGNYAVGISYRAVSAVSGTPWYQTLG